MSALDYLRQVIHAMPPRPSGYPDTTILFACPRHGGESIAEDAGSREWMLREMYFRAPVFGYVCGCAVALPKEPSPEVTSLLREELKAMAEEYDRKKKLEEAEADAQEHLRRKEHYDRAGMPSISGDCARLATEEVERLKLEDSDD